MRYAAAFGTRNAPYEDAPVFDAHIMRRNAVIFVSGFSLTRLPMELPVVPGTHHIVFVEPPLPERSSDMIADRGYRPELTIPEG
jgi:hypothetical protein